MEKNPEKLSLLPLLDIGSDHSPVIGKIHVQIQKHTKPKRIPRRYDVTKLRCSVTKANFQTRIGGRFEPLLNQDTDDIKVYLKVY